MTERATGTPPAAAEADSPASGPPASGPPADAADSRSRSGRSVATVALYTALSNFVLPLTSLATAPILARELGATGRGEMAAVVAPVFILVALASMGLPEAGAYAVAKLREEPRRVLRAAGWLTLAYGAVAVVLLVVVAPAYLRNAPHLVSLLRAVALLVPVSMWLLLVKAVVIGTRAHGVAALERVLTPLLRLGVFVALWVTGGLTVTTAVWAHLLCSVVGGSLLVVALLRRGPLPPAELTPTPVERLSRHVAAYGLRGWGAVLGNLVIWRLDQVVLVALVSPRQLGYYVVAVSFAEISAMVVNSVRNMLFTEAAARDDRQLIARASRVMVLLVTGSAVVGIVVAEPLIRLLFGSDFAPSVRLAQVLMVASIPFCVDQMVTAGVYAEGHPGLRSVSQITSAVVTVGLLVVLAPQIGAMGAAVASLAAYCVGCAITVVAYHRITRVAVRHLLVPGRSDLALVAGLAAKVSRKVRGR